MAPSTSSPAMLAASQAFGVSKPPQSRLAAGAAAAALRSMSPATTPVNNVQTKRMVDRQSSIGSNAPRGRSRGDKMVRRSSSASMTERTFREPSPGRPSTATGAPISSRQQEPPVPKLPENYNNIPPVPVKSSRRSASIDEFQMRKDNVTRQAANHNSTTGLPNLKAAANPGLAAARRVSSGSEVPQLTRADSNNSHNFSYPNRARPTSPPPQQYTPRQTSATTRQTVSKAQASPTASPSSPTYSTPKGISPAEVRNIQHGVAQAAQQPVKKKKKREGPLNEGSHLQTGTMGQKPIVTPLAPGPPAQDQTSLRDVQSDQNMARIAGEGSHFPPAPSSPVDSNIPDFSDSEISKSRRAQRASGALQKQPSVVREDWEGEQDEGSSSVEPSPATTRFMSNERQTTEANVSRKIGGNNSKLEQQAADPPVSAAVATLRTPEGRKSSLSPSRSARFSSRLSADMTEGEKHVPPPRSVSPRKPALKHASSPRLLAADAHRARDSSLSPSEATDLSIETPYKAKKSAHVKFDTHPSVVGIAAEPATSESPIAASPQNQKDKKWFGMRKSPNRVYLAEDSDEEEDTMKPRPLLPTFGSVRNGRKSEPESTTSQRGMPSPSSSSTSSISSGTAPTTMDASISSDHAIGRLLSQEAYKQDSNQQGPQASEVSSVGTGRYNATESIYAQAGDQNPSVTATNTSYQTTSLRPRTESEEDTQNADRLPRIAVQPATPGVEENDTKPQDSWLVEVPGSFPSNPSIYAAVTAQQPEKSEPLAHDSAARGHEEQRERMPSIQEEDSDRDSVYSDAAEEIDGDGFGSINAIVRSPVAPTPTTRQSVAETPVIPAQLHNTQYESERSEADWEPTEARWRERVENAKRASLQPAAPITEARSYPSENASQPQPLPQPVPAKPPVSLPRSEHEYSATPARQSPTQTRPRSTLKKSVRKEAESAQGPPSQSLNPYAITAEPPKPMRSSMRGPAAAAPAASTGSTPATNLSTQAQGALQKKSLRGSSQASQKPLPPVDNDSDSESSFRRRRRMKGADSGKYAMRRSMRAEPATATSTVDRRAVRSVSPVQRRPFSPVGGQPSMRTTMRGSVDKTPTLRGNQGSEKRSSSLFGRKAPSISSAPPLPVANGNRPRRDIDSDDERDTARVPFKSRFRDSSDEEDDLRPVRGIPRGNKDDDSTDLEDSSDDEGKKSRKSGRNNNLSIAVPSSPQPIERPMSPSSPDGKKKRGFFGRRKKDKEEPLDAKPQNTAPVVNNVSTKSNVTKKGAETAALGFRSDAEKEALIEQTRQKLEAAKERPTSPRSMSPTRGKLQRRMTPQRIMSDSWPLPPKIPDDVESPNANRPATSDGSAAGKPPPLDRQPSSAATSPTNSADISGKSGKKKRFPMLRKAFGLKD